MKVVVQIEKEIDRQKRTDNTLNTFIVYVFSEIWNLEIKNKRNFMPKLTMQVQKEFSTCPRARFFPQSSTLDFSSSLNPFTNRMNHAIAESTST